MDKNIAELTLEIVDYDRELENYLLSLQGILEVKVDNPKNFLIYIKYNTDLISLKIIKLEIDLFLNTSKIPCLVSFDKHKKTITKEYKMHLKDICCEYCFMGLVEDMLLTLGIEKVNSNFSNDFFDNKNITVIIQYDEKLICQEELKKIEQDFLK